MDNDSKNGNFSTLMLFVLKDIRLERGVHQGYIAQVLGKTPGAWSKIENGQSPLTMDAMFAACSALQINPSYAMTIVEGLVKIFNQHGYYFQAGNLDENEDVLLALGLKFFNSKGYEAFRTRPYDKVSVMAIGNPFNTTLVPTIVRYCTEPEFRKWMDDGAFDAPSSLVLFD